MAPIDGRRTPTDKCEFRDSFSRCEVAGADMVLPGLKRIRRLRAQSRNLRWDGLSAFFAVRRHHEIPTLFPPLLCNRFLHLVHGDRISPGTGRWLVLLCVAPMCLDAFRSRQLRVESHIPKPASCRLTDCAMYIYMHSKHSIRQGSMPLIYHRNSSFCDRKFP